VGINPKFSLTPCKMKNAGRKKMNKIFLLKVLKSLCIMVIKRIRSQNPWNERFKVILIKHLNKKK